MGGLFVVGMHRSGTSAVTRVLNLLGVPLCRDEDLLPLLPGAGNQLGHWEPMTVMLLDDRVLRTLGTHWACPAGLGEDWVLRPEVRALEDEARTAFLAVHPTPDWACKDPRLCLTLPFWRQTLGGGPSALVVLRNPLDVAHSLRARNGFPLVHGLALWERSTRAALAGIDGMSVRVVRYDDLLAVPHRWCAEMVEWLIGEGLTAAPFPEAVSAFLDVELRHGTTDDAALSGHPGVSAHQRALHGLAVSLVGEHARFAAPDPGPETPSTDEVLASVAAAPDSLPKGPLDVCGVAALAGVDVTVVRAEALAGRLPPPITHTGTGAPVWGHRAIAGWLAHRAATAIPG